jgi:hypothetical protein
LKMSTGGSVPRRLPIDSDKLQLKMLLSLVSMAAREVPIRSSSHGRK